VHNGARNNSAPAKWSIVWKECLTRTWRCQADGPRSGQMSIAVSYLVIQSLARQIAGGRWSRSWRGDEIAPSNQNSAGDCCLSAPYSIDRQLKFGRCRQRDFVLPPVSAWSWNVRIPPVDAPKPVHTAGRAMIDNFNGLSAPARVKTCPVCTYTYMGATCGHCGRTGAGTARVRNTRLKIASVVPRGRAALSIAEPSQPFKGR
jgi:hypothetical protein